MKQIQESAALNIATSAYYQHNFPFVITFLELEE